MAAMALLTRRSLAAVHPRLVMLLRSISTSGKKFEDCGGMSTSDNGGGMGTFEKREDDAGLHIRVDMPGLGEEHLKFIWNSRLIAIVGEGPKGDGDCEGGDVAVGPKYIVQIPLPPRKYNFDYMYGEIKNGVFRVLVPITGKAEED